MFQVGAAGTEEDDDKYRRSGSYQRRTGFGGRCKRLAGEFFCRRHNQFTRLKICPSLHHSISHPDFSFTPLTQDADYLYPAYIYLA
jgi:hypothetical protein